MYVCVCFFLAAPILVCKAALISLQLLLVTCHVSFPVSGRFVCEHISSEPTHPFICFS